MALVKMLVIFLACSSLHSCYYQDYFNYFKQYPQTFGPCGDYQKGEIEIIQDEQVMQEIEKKTGRKVGIVAEDKYWLWINDAVRFPKGSYGVYGRIFSKNNLKATAGVAILPLLENGDIALIKTYRHATREWEYEIPRGGLLEGDSPEEAARRELKEETGLVVKQLILLGYMNPDSGLTKTSAPVFLAQVASKEQDEKEDSEAIASVDAFCIAELKKGFLKGFLEDKQTQNPIHLKDPFLSFGLLQAALRGRISF